MNVLLKELLIVVYVLLGYDAYFDRFSFFGLSLNGLLYTILFLIVLFGLIMASYIKNHFIRIGYGAILFVSSVFILSYQRITTDFLSYNIFVSLINAQGSVVEAIQQFFSPLLTSTFISALLLLGIALKPKRSPPLPNRSFELLPVMTLLFLTSILFMRGGDGAKGLPPPFTPLAYSGLALYEASNNLIGPRKDVQITRSNKIIDHDIIFIIDESIAPSYFDINSGFGVTTHLNDAHPNFNIYNYGYAASVSNCSSETNVTLRYGGTRNAYMTINSTLPSIWTYAKHARMHTVYIDAQRTGKRLQNYMTEQELADIDEFIQFDQTPVRFRDMAAADKLVEYINNATADFIIVNKVGAHFPIHDKYPDRFMKYTPTLPRGQFLNISDTGSRDGFSGNTDDWVLYRNAYKNTLLWNVGEFFNKLFTESGVNNAVIVYTSDHGQDLHEDGNPGLNTHCSTNPRMVEGMVPLLVIDGRAHERTMWTKYLSENKNRSSHYTIFPTLLSLMAYDNDQVSQIYGHSLHKKVQDEQTFNARFYARLGKKPDWRKIDPANIIAPPESIASIQAQVEHTKPVNGHNPK